MLIFDGFEWISEFSTINVRFGCVISALIGILLRRICPFRPGIVRGSGSALDSVSTALDMVRDKETR